MIGRGVEFLLMHALVIVPLVLLVLIVWLPSARIAASFLLRVLTRPLLLLAVVALVYDGTRTLAGGSGLVFTPFLEHWQQFAPRSVANLQAFVNRTIYPGAWEAVVVQFVRLPAWLLAGGLGLLLAWIGRKRHRPDVFVN